jgi:hypothetical protein
VFIAPADAPLPYSPISIIDVSMRHSHRRTVADGSPSRLDTPARPSRLVRRLAGLSHDAFVAGRVGLLGPITRHFRT